MIELCTGLVIGFAFGVITKAICDNYKEEKEKEE